MSCGWSCRKCRKSWKNFDTGGEKPRFMWSVKTITSSSCGWGLTSSGFGARQWMMFLAGKKPIFTYSWSIASLMMDGTQSHDMTVLVMIECTTYIRWFKMLSNWQISSELQVILFKPLYKAKGYRDPVQSMRIVKPEDWIMRMNKPAWLNQKDIAGLST